MSHAPLYTSECVMRMCCCCARVAAVWLPGQLMSDHGVSAVPVIGMDGMSVGVFSCTDVKTICSSVDVYPSLFRSMREFLVAKVSAGASTT